MKRSLSETLSDTNSPDQSTGTSCEIEVEAGSDRQPVHLEIVARTESKQERGFSSCVTLNGRIPRMAFPEFLLQFNSRARSKKEAAGWKEIEGNAEQVLGILGEDRLPKPTYCPTGR